MQKATGKTIGGVEGSVRQCPVTMVRGTRSAYFPVLNETGVSDVPRLASAPMSRAPPFLAQSVAGNQRTRVSIKAPGSLGGSLRTRPHGESRCAPGHAASREAVEALSPTNTGGSRPLSSAIAAFARILALRHHRRSRVDRDPSTKGDLDAASEEQYLALVAPGHV